MALSSATRTLILWLMTIPGFGLLALSVYLLLSLRALQAFTIGVPFLLGSVALILMPLSQSRAASTMSFVVALVFVAIGAVSLLLTT